MADCATISVDTNNVSWVVDTQEVLWNVISEATTEIVTENIVSYEVIDSCGTTDIVETTDIVYLVDSTLKSSVLVDGPEDSTVISECIPLTIISEEEMAYSKRVDFVSDDLLYKAEALPGASTSAPVWRIRKITLGSDGDVTEQWADGDSLYNKVWDDHLNLTYI
jgi:hypothetical protein